MTKEMLTNSAQNFITTAGMAIALIMFAFVVWLAVQVYGQDIDPNAYCLYANQYPFNYLCNNQKIDKTLDDVMETAKRFDCYNNPVSDCPP